MANTVEVSVVELIERQGERIDGIDTDIRDLRERMIKAEGGLAAIVELKDDIRGMTEAVRTQSLAVHDVVKALAVQKKFFWLLGIPLVTGLAIEIAKHLLGL